MMVGELACDGIGMPESTTLDSPEEEFQRHGPLAKTSLGAVARIHTRTRETISVTWSKAETVGKVEVDPQLVSDYGAELKFIFGAGLTRVVIVMPRLRHPIPKATVIMGRTWCRE
jgi:hypothetical protein